MKKLLTIAVLLSGLIGLQIEARRDTFINDTPYQAVGKIRWKTLLCRDDVFDLAPKGESGNHISVNANICELDGIDTVVYVPYTQIAGERTALSGTHREVTVPTYRGSNRFSRDTTYMLRTERSRTGETTLRWVRSTK